MKQWKKTMNEQVKIEIEWVEKELEETSDVPVELEINEVALTIPRKSLKQFLTSVIWDVFSPKQIMGLKVEDRVIWGVSNGKTPTTVEELMEFSRYSLKVR